MGNSCFGGKKKIKKRKLEQLKINNGEKLIKDKGSHLLPLFPDTQSTLPFNNF